MLLKGPNEKRGGAERTNNMNNLNNQEMLYILALVNGKTPADNETIRRNIIYKLTAQINSSDWYGEHHEK